MMGILPSVEMAMWVAVGGRGRLSGAVVGAILVNGAKSFLSESFPSIWLYFLGSIFIAVTLFFPDGIMGVLSRIKPPWRRVKSGSEPSTSMPGFAAHDKGVR
jgi:urea transport system permease protein